MPSFMAQNPAKMPPGNSSGKLLFIGWSGQTGKGHLGAWQGCKRVPFRKMSMPETTARGPEPTAPLAAMAEARIERSAATPWDYEALREIVRNEPLPLALVDLNRFDENVR